MTRIGIVGIAGAVLVAAALSSPVSAGTQAGSATDKKAAPAAQTTEKKPAAKPAAPAAQNPDKKPASEKQAPAKASEAPAPLPPPEPSQPDKPVAATGSIGSVNVPHKVMADGQPLAAGTYTLRVSNDAVTPVSGQTVEESKYIEFVQGGQVKAKVLSTVVTNATAKRIADRGTPGPGATKVETLKGDAYLRIWIVKGPTSYLIHLNNAG